MTTGYDSADASWQGSLAELFVDSEASTVLSCAEEANHSAALSEIDEPIIIAPVIVEAPKKVKSRRFLSPASDARFLLENAAVWGSPEMAVSDAPSVILAPTPSPTSLPDSHPRVEKRNPHFLPKKSVAVFWQRYASITPHRQRHAPPTWADASDALKLHFIHLAAASVGRAATFTLNLSHAVEDEARDQGDHSLDWLRRRLARRLKDAFGRNVDFFLALEHDAPKNSSRIEGRLHCHGELVLLSEDIAEGILPALRRARDALRAAGGYIDAPHARGRQCRLSVDPNAGWITYLCKRSWMHSATLKRIRLATIGPRSCAGSEWIGASNQLRRVASDLLSRDRAAFLKSA